MATTLLDVITDALTSIGQAGQGQSISPEQAQQGLRVTNRMLQDWSLKKLMVYLSSYREFTLAANTQDYQIGPTAPVGFTGNRPVIVQLGQIAPPGSKQFAPLNILDQDAWNAIRDKGATCSASGLPQDIWPEYSFPNMAFHMWTIPSNACVLRLGTIEVLQQFVSVADELALPPGYEDAIVTGLGVRLAPYYQMPVTPDMVAVMAGVMSDIQTLNAQTLQKALGESQTLEGPSKSLPPGSAQLQQELSTQRQP